MKIHLYYKLNYLIKKFLTGSMNFISLGIS